MRRLALFTSLFWVLLAAPTQILADGALPEEVIVSAEALRDAARDDRLAYQLVESLTTEVGPRLAGTDAEARARQWAVQRLTQLGFSNVRIEPFRVPVWTRGIERAEVVSPFPQSLAITTLGGSSSTGRRGVTGQVVRVTSLDALRAMDDKALKGRVVFVDEPMTRTRDGSGYGLAVAKRRATAYEAERLGAVAALIRSVGTSSHRFPHAGQMRRATESGPAGVPTAALAAPDADQLQRALQRADGGVELKLVLTPQTEPAGESGNVIAEIPGSSAADEIVLVGAHLDSWDLGTGAVDDGAGVGIVVAAAQRVLATGTSPRRTIRVVLFGAEEVGLIGAKAYAKAHAEELDKHIVAAESDFGADTIWRFDTRFDESKADLGIALAALLRPLGIAPSRQQARGGPDLKYLREAGVPVVQLYQNGWDYFDLHHTPDDTFDKIDADDLAQNVAAYTAFLYTVANMPGHFRTDSSLSP